MGNGVCGVQPTLAQSWKQHGSGGPNFPVTLPLTGPFGIECRTGPIAGNHQVIITLPGAPSSITDVKVTPGQGGTASVANSSVAGNQVTVNLTNVSDAQLLTIDLLGVTIGASAGDVIVPMGVLLGDVNATTLVDGNDVSVVQGSTRQTLDNTTFRRDVNTTGLIDGNDVALTQGNTRNGISP